MQMGAFQGFNGQAAHRTLTSSPAAAAIIATKCDTMMTVDGLPPPRLSPHLTLQLLLRCA